MNRWLRVGLMGLGSGAFALAVHHDFPLCPLAGSIGIPCPGCGLTRATLALLHGDVRSALHFHPLVLVIAPLVAVLLGSAVLELLRAPSDKPRRYPLGNARSVSIAAVILFVATIGVWAARFAGYFGGPVPVTSMRDWITRAR